VVLNEPKSGRNNKIGHFLPKNLLRNINHEKNGTNKQKQANSGQKNNLRIPFVLFSKRRFISCLKNSNLGGIIKSAISGKKYYFRL
jgi:hypothetical protein